MTSSSSLRSSEQSVSLRFKINEQALMSAIQPLIHQASEMSLTATELNDLTQARIQKYAAGFIHLSSEEVGHCWSQDLDFTDFTLGKYNMTYEQTKSFQTTSFDGMKSMQILESHVTGSLEFTTWEMLIEIEFKSGQKEFVRGTSMITWRPEGGSSQSPDLKSVDDWKIVCQRDYFVGLKPQSPGISLRLFDKSLSNNS